MISAIALRYNKLSKAEKAAIIGGFFLLITASISSVTMILTSRQLTRLELVDFKVNDETESFPKILIKLRNTGNRIAYLKRATVHVQDVLAFHDIAFWYAEQVSWNYDIDLPPQQEPYSKSVDLSQAIKPNDVDYFTITLGHKFHAGYGVVFYIYNISVDLFHDGSNSLIKTEPIVFKMPSLWHVTGWSLTMSKEMHNYFANENIERVEYIKKLKGLKTGSVLNFINDKTHRLVQLRP